MELTLGTEATHATQQLSAGLVVGLQELLAALKLEQGGSGAVHAMVAMQNTVAAAIAVRRDAPGQPPWGGGGDAGAAASLAARLEGAPGGHSGPCSRAIRPLSAGSRLPSDPQAEGAAVDGGMKVTLAVMALIMASMPRGGPPAGLAWRGVAWLACQPSCQPVSLLHPSPTAHGGLRHP
jgi:hypothetical protein